jgi:hypothetical protein
VKLTTKRSIETGPNTGVAVVVKNCLAALSGSHRVRKVVRKPPARNPAISTPT